MNNLIVLKKKRTAIPRTASVTPINPQLALNTNTGAHKAANAQTPNTHSSLESKFYELTAKPPSTVNFNGQSLNTQELLSALINQHVIRKRTLITTAELAHLLSLQPQTIAKWRSSNVSDLPTPIRISRQIRYDLSEVMLWAEKHRLVPCANTHLNS